MRKKQKTPLLFLVLLFLTVNILYASYFISTKNQPLGAVLSSTTESCPLACEQLIDQKIATALAGLSSASSAQSIIPTTNYISLGSGGSTTLTSWTVVEGSNFNFNLADYPTGAKVYWEGNLKALSGNSRCYARLYDKTHYRAVDYSQQSTDQISYQSLTSQGLSIWRGNNQYRLEIKSLNGIKCFLTSPNLVVKY